jgi:hypothetical protein
VKGRKCVKLLLGYFHVTRRKLEKGNKVKGGISLLNDPI